MKQRGSGAFNFLTKELNEEIKADTPETQPEKAQKERPEPAKPAPKKTNKQVSKSKPAATGDRVIEIDPDRITSWQYKDRKEIDLDSLDYRKIVESIARRGQDSPILVRPAKSGKADYEEIYGFQRRHACKALGIKVKAIVRDLSDREAFSAQVVENDRRSGLSWWRKAESYQDAYENGLYPSMEAMAIECEQGASTIRNYIRVAAQMPKVFKEKLPLERCSRDVLYFLIGLGISHNEDILTQWAEDVNQTWKYDLDIQRKPVEKAFQQFVSGTSHELENKPAKKDGAKTYVGKAGKLFSISRKGDNVLISILKDGRSVMTDSEIGEALQEIMDKKTKS